MIKRITAAVISVIIAVSALSGCSEAIPSVVFSANGEQMATLTTSDWGRVELSKAGYASYVDAVELVKKDKTVMYISIMFSLEFTDNKGQIVISKEYGNFKEKLYGGNVC